MYTYSFGNLQFAQGRCFGFAGGFTERVNIGILRRKKIKIKKKKNNFEVESKFVSMKLVCSNISFTYSSEIFYFVIAFSRNVLILLLII